MCGFAGFIGEPVSLDQGKANLLAMGDALRQRGPDDEGIWLREDIGVGLAHRRLAVNGLGIGGHQPMPSKSGRFVIAYNGEIYNFRELGLSLGRECGSLRGLSDTEILLAAIEKWGLDKALGQTVGMFAFALWDMQERTLTLVRDRFGEKPLYCGWQGKTFLFGSTLKSLKRHPAWRGEINHDALADLVEFNYVPGPASIYRQIRKLTPGTWLALSWKNGHWEEVSTQYWSAIKSVHTAKSTPFRGDFLSATDCLEEHLARIVKAQMTSDVPVGAFLSAGIDSSTIASVMQGLSEGQVKTFTLAFEDKAYDESNLASVIAKKIGTEHVTKMLTHGEAIDLIQTLPEIYDEPFADASQIPTAILSRRARSDVTVVLTGDGGDEVFGGYNRYIWAPKLLALSSLVPTGFRAALGKGISRISLLSLERLIGAAGIQNSQRHLAEKIQKASHALASKSSWGLYERLRTFWAEGSPLIRGRDHARNEEKGFLLSDPSWTFRESMMFEDTVTYLPDDVLVKLDRASMSVGLEARAPFLDHRLFEFAWSLPIQYRIGNKGSKLVLRSLLSRHVPSVLTDQPKSGFAVPIGDYLRGPLRDWAEGLLDSKRLNQEGLFDVVKVRRAWGEHLSRQSNRQYDLWSILMFQAWTDAQD